ncbi:MAG: methionyl-tRNA formyltransferase [Nitrospirota bacterium]|nr:methionyl-tRNA formyltransferase [Nitrospirota bacterium]
MRIFFFGTPDFAIPSLNALMESGEDIVGVVSQPDRLKGRGHKLSRPPVKEFAILHGIPVMQPPDIKTPSFFEELSAQSPEIIIVVAYGKLIPPDILRLPPMGCINVHASLLPEYRGAAPIQRALINGETVTGVTTMFMDEGLDTGDILLQEETVINSEDNAYTLGLKLAGIGAALLVRTLDGLRDNSVQRRPQTGEPSYAPVLKKDDGRIDWSLPAKKILDLIRGTYPWPGSYCYFNKERISVIGAKLIDTDTQSTPGMIIKITGNGLHIGTGKGIISLLEVKPEGRKPMSGRAFANGRCLRELMILDAI